MIGAYMAANQQSASGQGGEYVNTVSGLSVAIGSSVTSVLYTPVISTNDVAMISLKFGQASIVPQSFTFQIYAGNPTSNGVLIYDSLAATGVSVKTALAYCASTLYAPYASGNNTLYIVINNTGQGILDIAFQGLFLEFAGNGVALPVYVPPAPYSGGLLSTVHVGPSEHSPSPYLHYRH